MKKRRIDIADSGALSDLAFLLIIFFIVIAVFNINKGFILGIPKKESTKVVNTKDIIKVKIDADGTLNLDNEIITLSDLETKVSSLLSVSPNLTFLLKIDPEVPFQEVVHIIEIAREMSIDNFSFSMDENLQ